MDILSPAIRRRLVDHLDRNVESGLGFSSPFKVCRFSPFPEEFYPVVIERLPRDDCYQELPHEDAMRADGTSTRTALLLDKLAPPFWRELSSVLCGAEVEDIFRAALGFDGQARAVARLLRDFSGYRIAPHPDSSKKACTVQFYLPSTAAQFDLGTSFYSRGADGAFTEAHKLPFLPNTGYGFKVTDGSWHGSNFQVMSEPRNSLIITYYKD